MSRKKEWRSAVRAKIDNEEIGTEWATLSDSGEKKRRRVRRGGIGDIEFAIVIEGHNRRRAVAS
jgi:hypothetical protein